MHWSRSKHLRVFLIIFLSGLWLPGAALALQADAKAELVAAGERLSRLHSVLVAHEGEQVFEHTFAGPGPQVPVNIKSLSKTVMAALVGVAVERDVIAGVDQPVVALLDERVPDNATAGVEEITVSHLLSLQAGLERTSGPYYGAWVNSDNWVNYILTRPFVDKPGGDMLYSTGSTHLLSAALTEASGKSTLALARTWLGEPLGVEIPAWTRDPQGIYMGGNNMRLSPHALLALGELYRNNGVHNGQRLLPANWVETSWRGRGRSAFTDDPYGYGWFMDTLAGERVFYGRGYGGQMLYVLPGLGVTAVMTSDISPPSPGSRYLRQQHDLLVDHVIPALRQAGE